jgi:asparagine synthase (glutamine-hydrolysing)
MAVSLAQRARQFRDRFAISPISRSVRAEGLTYLSESKIRRIENVLREVADVPGCTAEFGVALGGSAIIIATLARDRCFHGFDVFETIPEPSSKKDDEKSRARFRTIAAGAAKGLKGTTYYGYRAQLYDDVVAAFAKHGVPVDGERIHLHKGLFEKTVPASDMGALAFAHIDCDWYDPVSYCLAAVADRLRPGGVIVIDDYHDYGGCRRAVDEFLSTRPDFAFEDGPNPTLRKQRG